MLAQVSLSNVALVRIAIMGWTYAAVVPPQTQLPDCMATASRSEPCLTKKNREAIEAAIEARAQDNGLTIDHATLTDGNCGPDSILRNLERLQPTDTNSSKILRVAARDRHRALAAMRLMMCIWIRDNASVEVLPGTTIEQYVQMDGDSIDTYCVGMRQPGAWIDTLMLFAASAVFNIQLVCLMPEPQLICAPSFVGQQSLLVCAIANLWHFWALEPKPPEEIVEPGGQAGHRGRFCAVCQMLHGVLRRCRGGRA